MDTVTLKSRTGKDGTLDLQVSTGLPETEVEVTVTVQPVPAHTPTKEFGWPSGFFEQTAGSIPDLERE